MKQCASCRNLIPQGIVGIATALTFVCALTPAAGQEYTSYAEIGPLLQTAEDTYPSICKRYDLGLSVQGKSIWALRISDNMPAEEDEPEFKYISTMHGDEPVGTPMCMYLIDHLLENYGVDPDITNLVDQIDIWIVPLMNPDGYELSPRRRENYNWVDLNRDFPNLGDPNTTDDRAAETAVIMTWSFRETFTCSANFHTGALVVNYPFDNDDSGSIYTPDNEMFIWISEQYSQYNLPMWNSSSFYHGITNGAEWYFIWGGMQDWNYHFMGNNEVTIELWGITKEPPASELPQFWDWNRDSMLAYMATCLIGVRGLVTDGTTGDPMAATVTVIGRDHDIYTDPDVGDYHRMLEPGTYDLRFEADGYDLHVESDVVVTSGDATRLDVTMSAPPEVVSPNGGEELTAGAPTAVSWTGSPSAQFHVQYTANADDTEVITEGFESGSLDPAFSTGGHAPWYVTTSSAHSGSHSARAGNITHNQQSWMTRTVSGGSVSFWYRVSSEPDYDYFNFYINGDREIHAAGNVGWTYYTTTLPSGTYELKWEYTKDENTSNGSDTAWIDDLQLTEDGTVWEDIIALTDAGATSTSWTPSAPGSDYKVRVQAYYGDSYYGTWDESDAPFTVLQQHAIPTVSEWGIVIMTLLTVVAGTVVFRQRPVPVLAGETVQRQQSRHSMTARVDMTGKRITLITLGLLVWASPLCFGGDELDIHSAARIGDLQRLQVLLDGSPDLINARDTSAETPLHQAVRGLHTDAVRLLLSAGADVNAKDRHGAGALHLAVLTGGNKKDEQAKRKALTAVLLDGGADAKAVEERGKTPLHLAAIKNRTELLDRLLEAGAEVGAKDSSGHTPLHGAALANHGPVIKWLLAKKADVNAVAKQGDTPLHSAARRFRKEATELLLGAGAKVDARNSRGQTPLHVAAGQGPAEVREVDRLLAAVTEVLLENEAEVNAKDNQGATPLHYALAQGHEKVAEVLRLHGGTK